MFEIYIIKIMVLLYRLEPEQEPKPKQRPVDPA